MGGGSAPSPPTITQAAPTAADTEAAAERARLNSLLRSRRGSGGLAYGPRQRPSLLATASALAAGLLSPVAPVSMLWGNPMGGGGGAGGYGGYGGDPSGNSSGESGGIGGGSTGGSGGPGTGGDSGY